LNLSICEFEEGDVNEKGRDSKEGEGKCLGEAISTTEDTFLFTTFILVPFPFHVCERKMICTSSCKGEVLSLDHSMIFSYLHLTSLDLGTCPFSNPERVYR